ncbi:MAG: hypothetical protein V1678_01865, partial [Candidatus Aenigmatarchaeota archaeon]
AAYGTVYLMKMNWQSKTIKNFTILILVCGLLFSGISQANRLTRAEPNADTLAALKFLKAQDPGVVFSDHSRGFWINYAHKENVMDDNFAFAPNLNERWADTQKLLYTRSLKDATEIIKKYNIQYIWIDDDMKKNIWTYEEEGLLFVIKYSPDFTPVYDKQGITIWRVTPDSSIKG